MANEDKLYYWRHDESCSVGTCDTEEELHDLIDQEPLIAEITKEHYEELVANGWDY